MAEEVKEGAEKQEAGKKGGKKKFLLFLVVGLLVIALASGVVLFLMGKKGEEKEGGKKAKKESAAVKVIYPLEPVVVNLLDPTGKRYLQVRLAFGVADKKAEEEIKVKEPMIKDVIITYLSSKTPEEVMQPDAKEAIKKDLLVKINEALGEEIVLAIYITQYIVE
ncbi:flagellar basal body-associated FliL family protein [Thermodesulfobacterium sp. TA1]|uniref:flagellar basal body-associated FliL family protein n=1 Tax=Thermodesulfobacterium sp. TA1 TaxID=2234087 RepID=UPI0012327A59|nr:flagellar basal body-associated FliL family protein [Thermodesulfobacterium sp. TA1]QER42135.1 flagellar basal body-associated FliL family protein [Thermodesulfobacterium sp. TA1]